jgi:hypothetical protein
MLQQYIQGFCKLENVFYQDRPTKIHVPNQYLQRSNIKNAFSRFYLFFISASVIDHKTAKLTAPQKELNRLEVFCLTLTFRIARSESLLSAGSSG